MKLKDDAVPTILNPTVMSKRTSESSCLLFAHYCFVCLKHTEYFAILTYITAASPSCQTHTTLTAVAVYNPPHLFKQSVLMRVKTGPKIARYLYMCFDVKS